MQSSLVRELFKSSRPISWVNTAYPFAVGFIAAGGSVDWRLIIGTFYFLIPYNLLMYGINDVFDYESDLRNPRKGGIEGVVLGKQLHRPIIWASLLTNVPCIILLWAGGDPTANLALLIVVGMVVAYSAPGLRFKERPFLDSITSSAHFVGPLVYAFALAGWPHKASYAIAAFFLWGMASHAFGAVQDITADRAAGIGSIATVIGARQTVMFAAMLYALAATTLLLGMPRAWPVAACSLLYIANITPYFAITDVTAEHAHAGWKRFIWLNFVTGAIVTCTLLVVQG